MAIKLDKIKESTKEGSFVFVLKGSNEAFANTMRRMIIEEVPTLAVEDVEIKDNNSALYDEMLALRLGLLPIKTDLSSYRLPESKEEVQEKSARCTLQIKLKAGKNGYVYAGEAQSADPKCTFVQEKMPIVKLLAKQKVDVTMTAVMGQGKDHIKWAPGLVFYKKEVQLDASKVKDAELVMQNCPDGVFTKSGNSLKVNEDKLIESNLAEYYAQLDEGISIEYTDNIIMTVESFGQLTPRTMLTTAADMLVAKVEELESQL